MKNWKFMNNDCCDECFQTTFHFFFLPLLYLNYEFILRILILNRAWWTFTLIVAVYHIKRRFVTRRIWTICRTLVYKVKVKHSWNHVKQLTKCNNLYLYTVYQSVQYFSKTSNRDMFLTTATSNLRVFVELTLEPNDISFIHGSK